MLRLQIISQFGQGAIELEASQVLICGEQGTPLAVAAVYGVDGGYCVKHANEPDFQRTLHALGINKTVVCDKLSLSPPPAGAQQLILPGS